MDSGNRVKAVILAAGYATRLYPLTLNIPKPLLKIKKDMAVIDFIADDLAASGIVDETIVITNHKFYKDFLKWGENRKSKSRVVIIDDGTRSNDDRLGAIGDIHFAVKKKNIASDLVVVGGDNLFDRGFANFFGFALKKKPFASLGLFDIRSRYEAARFGVVTVDKDSKVSSFLEKPQKPQSTLVAACLYYFPKETLGLLDKYVKDATTSNDAPGNYIRWLLEEDKVYGFTLKKGHWHDIGHFDAYKEVVEQFNRTRP